MKPSGIEWLGDVPAHWTVTRLGNLFREVAEPGNEDLPILSVSIHHGVSDDEMAEEDMDRKVTRSDGSTFGSKMPRASWEFVGGMKVPVPPMSEQVFIATFLDRETAKIDALRIAPSMFAWLQGTWFTT